MRAQSGFPYTTVWQSERGTILVLGGATVKQRKGHNQNQVLLFFYAFPNKKAMWLHITIVNVFV